MEIVTSWIEEGIRRGRVEGRQEGQHSGKIELLISLLNARFSSIGSNLEGRIASLNDIDVNNLTIAQFSFSSVADIVNWLDQH